MLNKCIFWKLLIRLQLSIVSVGGVIVYHKIAGDHLIQPLGVITEALL